MTETIVPVIRTCPFCGNTTKILITEETDEAYYMYSHYQVGYIQDIPVDQFQDEHCKAIVREYLKMGTCMDCQYLLFGGKKMHYREVKAYKG